MKKIVKVAVVKAEYSIEIPDENVDALLDDIEVMEFGEVPLINDLMNFIIRNHKNGNTFDLKKDYGVIVHEKDSN